MPESESSKIAAIQQRHQNQRNGIVTAVEFAAKIPRAVAEVAAHHALSALADALRAEAKAITEARTKGHVSTAKELTGAAGRAMAVAVKLPGALTTASVAALPTQHFHATTAETAALNGATVLAPDEPAASGHYAPGTEPEALTLPSGSDPTEDGGEMSDVFYDPSDEGTALPPVNEADPGALQIGAAIPSPRVSVENLSLVSVAAVLQPTEVIGLDGQSVKALFIGETVTPPVPSLTDPFADPGGRQNARRLTMAEFRGMAATLKNDPSHYMSVSKVQGISDCSMRYAFSRLARRGQVAPERPQWHFIGGNAFHAWAAWVEHCEWAYASDQMPAVTGRPSDDGYLSEWEAFLQQEIDETLAGTTYTIHDIRASNRGLEGFDWWRVNGADMCAKYLTHHDDEYRAEWETVTLGAEGPNAEPKPALEVEYYLPIGDADTPGDGTTGPKAHGFMDIIRRNRQTGIVRIDDYKSGKSEGSSFQLASYAHAASRVFGIAGPILVSNWMAREGKYTPAAEAVLRYSWDDLVYDYETAAEIDRRGLFVAHPTTYCGGCPFESICPKRYGV